VRDKQNDRSFARLTHTISSEDTEMLARIRKAQEEEGFTLIELLVVIIIIGILAAIAIPVFLNQRKKGVDASLKADLHNYATAEETYLTDYNSYTGTIASLTGVNASGTNVITANANGGNSYCITATNTTASNNGPFYLDSTTGQIGSTKPAGCP
jgi:type IV pilus assembly protein PilA